MSILHKAQQKLGGLALMALTSQAFAEETAAVSKGVQFPIVTAPEPSTLATLALYLLALVALVAVVRRKRSPAGR